MKIRTGIYIARVQSICCSFGREFWTVRAKSIKDAKRRIGLASKANVYEVYAVSGNPWRQFTTK